MKFFFALSISLFVLAACQTAVQEKNTDQAPVSETPDESAIPGNENFTFEGCFQAEESEGGNKSVTFIIMQIKGSEVTGEEAVEMTGPEYNAVGAGSFEGKLENGIITVIFDYEIEGSAQKEEQEFKLMDNGLMMSQGPLQEKDGMLVLQQKGLFNKLVPLIDCP